MNNMPVKFQFVDPLKQKAADDRWAATRHVEGTTASPSGGSGQPQLDQQNGFEALQRRFNQQLQGGPKPMQNSTAPAVVNAQDEARANQLRQNPVYQAAADRYEDVPDGVIPKLFDPHDLASMTDDQVDAYDRFMKDQGYTPATTDQNELRSLIRGR